MGMYADAYRSGTDGWTTQTDRLWKRTCDEVLAQYSTVYGELLITVLQYNCIYSTPVLKQSPI
jgi:hypothetical protein